MLVGSLRKINFIVTMVWGIIKSEGIRCGQQNLCTKKNCLWNLLYTNLGKPRRAMNISSKQRSTIQSFPNSVKR